MGKKQLEYQDLELVSVSLHPGSESGITQFDRHAKLEA